MVARLHRRAGEDQLVLLDARRDRVVVLAAVAYDLLCQADGTRDHAGIAAAARRFGVEISIDHVERMFAELAALDWLADGPVEGLLEGEAQPVAADDPRVVREMVAGRYHCDGRGDCCRSYPTISLVPADLHRVCATLPDDATLAHRPHRVFLPTVGSAPTPMRALALVDGACRFLEPGGACRVHRVGGAQAKPIGCAWFPTRLVDDGTEVRAAPAVECVCVARPDPTAPPLLPEIRVCDLPLGILLLRIPARVGFGPGAFVDRAEAVAGLERLAAAVDPPRALWAWGRRLATHGAWQPPAAAPTIEAAEIATRFAAVASRASIRGQVEATWRGPDDVVSRRLQLIRVAAQLLAAPTAVGLVDAAGGDHAIERHVLDVAVFSRSLLLGDVAEAACDLALQMWLARAVAAFAEASHDVTTREAPLAMVAATWRAQRLGA